MNLFIAGVGNVELFKGNDSVLVSKTLVDSSINLSVSLEDIRAGEGAKLYGKYAHSSGMTMKLTDAMFRLDFLAANIGAVKNEESGNAVKSIEKIATAEGKIDLTDVSAAAQPLYDGAKQKTLWWSLAGVDKWNRVDFDGTIGEYAVSGATAGDKVCVRYLNSQAGEHIKVMANFIPDTLTAILTAPLFAGGENIGNSTKVGTLTITIPRFMLNGTTDLSMSMTGASQTALEGSALAVEGDGCDDEGYYAIISQVINNASVADGLIALQATPFATREEAVNEPIQVYGIYKGEAIPKLLSRDSYEVTPQTEGVIYNSTTGKIEFEKSVIMPGEAWPIAKDIECTVELKDVGEFSTTVVIPGITEDLIWGENALRYVEGTQPSTSQQTYNRPIRIEGKYRLEDGTEEWRLLPYSGYYIANTSSGEYTGYDPNTGTIYKSAQTPEREFYTGMYAMIYSQAGGEAYVHLPDFPA